MRRGLAIGLLAPPAAGLLIASATAWRSTLPAPCTPGFAAAVHSDAYSAWAGAVLNGLVWLCFGAVALHKATPSAAPRARFYGAAFLLAGAAVALPVAGVLGIAWPAAPEHAAAMAQSGTLRLWVPFSAASFVLGGALLAWALRAGGAPAACWAGVAAGGVGFAFLFVPHVQLVPVLGILAFTAATGWLALEQWRQDAA